MEGQGGEREGRRDRKGEWEGRREGSVKKERGNREGREGKRK